MKILIIEDEATTAATVQAILSAEQAVCDVSQSGEEGFEIGKIYEYDAIILDLNLPDINGYELLKKIRESSIRAPILILSGMHDIADKVKALGFGADDYVTKPFSKQELVARVKTLIRRAKGHASPVITVGSLVLNIDTKTITAMGEQVSLTSKEYKILELLMLRKGISITKESFINYLYSGLDEPEAKIIDVFMCKIRRKLEESLGEEGRSYIATIWGRGYIMHDPFSFIGAGPVAQTESSTDGVVPITAAGASMVK